MLAAWFNFDFASSSAISASLSYYFCCYISAARLLSVLYPKTGILLRASSGILAASASLDFALIVGILLIELTLFVGGAVIVV